MEQKFVRALVFTIAGVVGLGALLDARSNALALSNTEAAILGVLIGACWLGAEMYLRSRRTSWRGHDGTQVTVTSLGPYPRLAAVGALALLAYSRFVAPGPIASLEPRSSRAALMLLAPEIERHLRAFMAATGFHNRVRSNATLPEAVDAISETWPLSPTFRDSVRVFCEVREKINHGYGVPDEEVLRAVESGKLILRTLEELKREVKVVVDTGVELFADSHGQTPRAGVWGLVLENTSSDGKDTKSLQVFPTTRTDYQAGDEVTWDFDMGSVYAETWYRDPKTREIKHVGFHNLVPCNVDIRTMM